MSTPSTNHGWPIPTDGGDSDVWGAELVAALTDIDAIVGIGTTTNDDAPLGWIGEYKTAETVIASEVALTSSIAANIVSVSLTAGDWDVWGVGAYDGNNVTVLNIEAWVSATSATRPTVPRGGINIARPGGFTDPAGLALPTGVVRFSLAGTTTVYLSTVAFFSAGAVSAYGDIYARRVR